VKEQSERFGRENTRLSAEPLLRAAMLKWTTGRKLTEEENLVLEMYLNGWWKTLDHPDPDLPLGDKF
jgi:hypothetical protein